MQRWGKLRFSSDAAVTVITAETMPHELLFDTLH